MLNLLKHPSRNAMLICLFALITVASAWGFELIGGFIPCPLCLEQRVPYYVIIPLTIILTLWANHRDNMALRLGFLIIAALALYGAGLGVYQSGAQWGFWPGPTTCGSGGGLSGVLPNLDNVKVIRCDEAQLRVLGLSFAGWNVVNSMIIALIAIYTSLGRRN